MIMITNIFRSNFIMFIELFRVLQYLIATVLIIGCWHQVRSQLLALILLFGFLLYQTLILLLNYKKHLILEKKNAWELIFFVDGIITGLVLFFCIINTTLTLSMLALFLLVYIQTLGKKSLLSAASLIGTFFICNQLSLEPYKILNHFELKYFCKEAIYFLLSVFFILHLFLRYHFDQSIRDDLTEESEINQMLKLHIFSLSKYLSPTISKIITNSETNTVQVNATDKPLSVFFSDMQGFSQLSEQLKPEKLSWLLNTYLAEMSEIIFKFGGTLDKTIGDSIMVFFGDPSSRGLKKDALACVFMAIAMKEVMQRLTKKWQKAGINSPPSIRMGINTGSCRVGNFGTDAKLDYTVLGHTVNLASHLESIAQPDEILISEETYNLVSSHIRCERTISTDSKWLSKSLSIYSVKNKINR
jgi:adenylate cyclase